MITGRLPFQSDSSMSVMYAHFNQRPLDITQLRADCPPNLAAAVMRMLEKEPEDRWPTMDDIVAVCGRPALRHDDPIRSEMITLAKAGRQSELASVMNAPTSPIALSRRRAVAGTSSRASRWWWALGAVAAAALLWLVAPWRFRLEPPAPPTQPVAAADSAVKPPPPAPVVVESTKVATRRARPATRSRSDSVPRAAARQEDSVLTSLRAAAIAALQRASSAGATVAELAHGDTMLRGADSLATAGRLSEAMMRMVTATSLWTESERAARARAAQQTVTTQPPAPPAPPPAPPAATDPRPAIEAAILAYARALETRDIREVRRAYSGLTPSQQQGWEDLFRAARSLKASLTVTAIDVQAARAEATVSGIYEFDNGTTGRVERRPATFHATLVADPTGWRISAIR